VGYFRLVYQMASKYQHELLVTAHLSIASHNCQQRLIRHSHVSIVIITVVLVSISFTKLKANMCVLKQKCQTDIPLLIFEL